MRKKEKPTKRKGKFLMFLGALLFLASISIAGYNNYEDFRSQNASDQILQKFEHGNKKETDDGEKYITIDGYDYIGYLSLPSIDLETPIMAQWDYDRLKIAPCRYYGTVKDSDLVIAGHNYARGFGRLYRLKVGDEIYFTDADNKKYKYIVGDFELLKPMDVTEMVESEWDLSLYTCIYSASKRYTVRCSLSDKK